MDEGTGHEDAFHTGTKMIFGEGMGGSLGRKWSA